MSQLTGAELRRRRELLGLTIEQVSVGTGLTRDALHALEGDATHRLTRGPYGDAYRTTYALFLDRVEAGDTAVPPTSAAADVPRTWPGGERPDGDIAEAEREVTGAVASPSRLPLPAVRAVAAITTLGALALVGWQATRELRPTEGDQPTIEVHLKMQRTARLRVEVDGQQALDRELAGREEATFSARSRVAIDVPSSDVLKVWLDGRPIEPRGQLGRPRTLVFLPGGEGVR